MGKLLSLKLGEIGFLLLSLWLSAALLACTPAAKTERTATTGADSSAPDRGHQPIESQPPPHSTDTVTRGYVQQFFKPGVSAIHAACTADARRIVSYEATLAKDGTVRAIRVTKSTGEAACDKAVVSALTRSRWKSCQKQGQPIACTSAGTFALPSAVHRGAQNDDGWFVQRAVGPVHTRRVIRLRNTLTDRYLGGPNSNTFANELLSGCGFTVPDWPDGITAYS